MKVYNQTLGCLQEAKNGYMQGDLNYESFTFYTETLRQMQDH